ncbi:MAG: FeoA family protein [Crocosphaera sp.]|nr:FeoA family protein [Crocosphaera sp.]
MMALSTLKTGNTGKVSCLRTTDEAIIRRLMIMGVVPGISVTLEQRFPSYIIKLGRSRATLDHETAKIIYLD